MQNWINSAQINAGSLPGGKGTQEIIVFYVTCTYRNAALKQNFTQNVRYH